MNTEGRFWIALWIVVATATLVLVALCYQSCETQRDRRMQCLKEHSAVDCRLLFPEDGNVR